MNQPLPATFVTQVDLKLADKIKKDLNDQGFEISVPQYTLFSGKKKGVSCTLYQSGKLTVQGKDKDAFIEFYLEPEVLKTFNYVYQDVLVDHTTDKTGRIGIDESGKGDFFGPLCVAGVYAEGDGIDRLKKMGVKDSKTLSDATIVKLAEKIRNEFPHQIVKINPPKYNELITQFKNLNRLLAWGHATTIEQMVEKTGCTKIIVDQFASEDVVLTAVKRKNLKLEITQRHRAEEDVVVAAASILARCAFVEGIEQLEKEYGLKLPKGASSKTISQGKEFVKKYGREKIGLVGKLHFKTLDSIIPKTSE